MIVTRRRTFLLTVVTVWLVSGCGSDVEGIPKGVHFGNWTATTISISHVSTDGARTVLVPAIETGTVTTISVLMKQGAAPCAGGTYVARDEAGQEVARRSENECDSWLVATADVPFTITNRTPRPIDVSYVGFEGEPIVNGIAPGTSFTGTIQHFGDPSALCLSGYLAASAGGSEIARLPVATCADWTWQVLGSGESGS